MENQSSNPLRKGSTAPMSTNINGVSGESTRKSSDKQKNAGHSAIERALRLESPMRQYSSKFKDETSNQRPHKRQRTKIPKRISGGPYYNTYGFSKDDPLGLRSSMGKEHNALLENLGISLTPIEQMMNIIGNSLEGMEAAIGSSLGGIPNSDIARTPAVVGEAGPAGVPRRYARKISKMMKKVESAKEYVGEVLGQIQTKESLAGRGKTLPPKPVAVGDKHPYTMEAPHLSSNLRPAIKPLDRKRKNPFSETQGAKSIIAASKKRAKPAPLPLKGHMKRNLAKPSFVKKPKRTLPRASRDGPERFISAVEPPNVAAGKFASGDSSFTEYGNSASQGRQEAPTTTDSK